MLIKDIEWEVNSWGDEYNPERDVLYGVITSYSIHYTKLYELANSI